MKPLAVKRVSLLIAVAVLGLLFYIHFSEVKLIRWIIGLLLVFEYLIFCISEHSRKKTLTKGILAENLLLGLLLLAMLSALLYYD